MGKSSGQNHFLGNTCTGNKLSGKSSTWETIPEGILLETLIREKISGKSSSWETLQENHFLRNTCMGHKLIGKSSSWETLQGRIIFLETLVREIN